jgi:hypothetical protein
MKDMDIALQNIIIMGIQKSILISTKLNCKYLLWDHKFNPRHRLQRKMHIFTKRHVQEDSSVLFTINKY